MKPVKISDLGSETNALYSGAVAARENSYSPYSHCKVGAAFRTSRGQTHAGCNVENSSYGATVCAERVAIQSAVAAGGKPEIEEMVVVTDASPPWPPCGMCRQVISEFSKPELKITIANLKGEALQFKLKDLFPHAFTPDFLADT
jgi:cytidine deaminase